jgi:hypothetical protein
MKIEPAAGRSKNVQSSRKIDIGATEGRRGNRGNGANQKLGPACRSSKKVVFKSRNIEKGIAKDLGGNRANTGMNQSDSQFDRSLYSVKSADRAEAIFEAGVVEGRSKKAKSYAEGWTV